MATKATWLYVPISTEPFIGKLDLGIIGGGLLLLGIGTFTAAETTVDIPARTGGLKPICVIPVQNIQDKNLTWVINADNTITLTRSNTDAAAQFAVLVYYH